MTRKHLDTEPSFAFRRRPLDDESKPDIHVADQSVPDFLAAAAAAAASNHGYTQMFQFGNDANEHIDFADVNTFLPCTVPTLQFHAPAEYLEDEIPQQHLLYSFISAELNAYGVTFEGYVHPFMNDLVADENNQPLMAPNDAEPEFVPVYPRQPSVAFTPPPSQTWSPCSSNPFGGERRIPPATRRTHRPLLPKGHHAPREAPVDAFDADEPAPSRGRKRALSPDSRMEAHEVRIMHACGRCHKKRERCGTTRPCKPCLGKNKRSLDLPCMQELPEDRWKRLFSESMYGHLELSQIQKELPSPDPDGQPFVIRLHQHFHNPELQIPVVPFVPKNPFHTKKSIFPIGPNRGGLVVQQTEITSPPLVPAFRSNDDSYPSFAKKFFWSVRRWLDEAEVDFTSWNKVFFRESYGKAWPRAIFGEVCKFYHRAPRCGCAVLKSCLQTTVLVYMTGHSFYVPDEDVDTVMERTFGPSHSREATEWVCPRYVDRFVKTLLLPVYKAGMKASLRGLQSLYSAPKPSAFKRDRILASSIVLLIVAATKQGKFIEKALAQQRQGQSVRTDEVFDQIRDIERHLIDLVMELWTYKFAPGAKMGTDEPADRFSADRAREFNLLQRFRNSYMDSIDTENLEELPTELPDNLDSSKFGIYNTERVLKKFYLVVFPEEY